MSCKPDADSSRAAGLPGRIPSHYRKAAVSALLILILVNIPAWASLGDSEASVTADQLHMKSEDHVQTFQAYKVHRLTRADGPTVREYVSPEGVVFGVAWQGRSTPDMNQLLGAYVTNLQTATPAQTRIRHMRGLDVKTSSLVYSNFCRMRVCRGSAYVPKLLPSGVSAEVIR